MTRSDEETLVRAQISSDEDIPEEVLERLGGNRSFALLSAATIKAVERKFPNGVTPAVAQEFVAELKRRFPEGASEIKPMVVEALLRTSFGEIQLLEGIEPEDLHNMLFLLPYAIMTRENLQDEEVDEYIDQVIQQADSTVDG